MFSATQNCIGIPHTIENVNLTGNFFASESFLPGQKIFYLGLVSGLLLKLLENRYLVHDFDFKLSLKCKKNPYKFVNILVPLLLHCMRLSIQVVVLPRVTELHKQEVPRFLFFSPSKICSSSDPTTIIATKRWLFYEAYSFTATRYDITHVSLATLVLLK